MLYILLVLTVKKAISQFLKYILLNHIPLWFLKLVFMPYVNFLIKSFFHYYFVKMNSKKELIKK